MLIRKQTIGKNTTRESMRIIMILHSELPLVVKAWARMGLGLKDKVK